jgi:hypothetical protein
MNVKENTAKFLPFLVGLIVLVYCINLLVLGSATFADSLRGFEILSQYREGAPFNTLNYPSVSRPDFSFYVAWWSPGQWVLPYALMKLFTIFNFQVLQACCIIPCLSLSLIAYHKLFRRMGFSKFTADLSIFCIVTNSLFYWHTLMFFGGDLFLLCFTPYFLLGIFYSLRQLQFFSFFLFLLLGFCGVFLKNSFLIFLLSWCSYVFFRERGFSLKKRIETLWPYALGVVLVFGVVHKIHLSLGETPGSAFDYVGYSHVTNDFIGDLCYSFGSPLRLFTRLMHVIEKVHGFVGGKDSLNSFFQVVPLLLTVLFFVKFPRNEHPIYFRFLLFFCLPYFMFFTFLYLQNRAVSYEMRHFAPCAFLFFPGIIHWLLSLRYSKGMFALIVLFCLLDGGLYWLHRQKIEETHCFWKSLKLPVQDVKVLKVIEKFDCTTANSLVIIENYWQISVGVRKNSKIVLHEKNGNLFVLSGMELNWADSIHPCELKRGKYDSILLVSANENSGRLLNLLNLQKRKELLRTVDFTVSSGSLFSDLQKLK